MRKFAIQPPFTSSSSRKSMPSTAEPDQVALPSASTSTLPPASKHGSRLLTGLKGMLHRRRSDAVVPPLPIDAVSTIKRARRQTYVMHGAPSPGVPKPPPILTLSSHHLVVRESDRRDLAARTPHHYSHLAPIPEYQLAGGGDSFTSSSSIASCSSSSSSTDSLDYSDDRIEPSHSHWSDDSSDEYDCTAQICQCNDLTLTHFPSRLCPACATQDVPKDEDTLDSDVDSLLDSYLDDNDDASSSYTRERWSSVDSSSSCSSTSYDPLFSPRSSSTSFTVASPRVHSKSRPETPVDIRDFDMILTSSPPSPHGVRFNRASIDARDALIAESRRKRVSSSTI
ncbi:hypothetical protein JCM11491_006017 [Sporobolomyces phaffii]